MIFAGYELPDGCLTQKDRLALERVNRIQNSLLRVDSKGNLFVDKSSLEAYLNTAGSTVESVVDNAMNAVDSNIRSATKSDAFIDFYPGMVEVGVLGKNSTSPFLTMIDGGDPEEVWTRYVAENFRGRAPSLRDMEQLARSINDPRLNRSFEQKASACFKQIGWWWIFWFCISLVVGIIMIVISGGGVAAILALILAAGLGATVLTALSLLICLLDAMFGRP
jgi:hypothetical protein